MWLTVFSILFIISNLYEEGKCLYMHGYKTLMKKKLTVMMRDLIFDSKAKIQSVRYLRDAYRATKAFQYASHIYELRRKYAKMLHNHQCMINRFNNYNHKIENRSIDYQPLMIEAIHTGIDIDHHVQAIEEYENHPHLFKKEIVYNNITRPKRSKKKKTLRYLRADERLHQMYSLIDRRWGRSKSGHINRPMRNNEFLKGKDISGKPNVNLKKNLDGLAFDSDLE